MNITLEQYNTVLDGLRTQLELQRAFNKELIFSRDRFKEAYLANIKQVDKVVKDSQQEKEEAAKQLEQLKSENFNLSKELNDCVKFREKFAAEACKLVNENEKLKPFEEAFNTMAKNYADLTNAHTMTLEEHSEIVIALKIEIADLKACVLHIDKEFNMLGDEFLAYKKKVNK